MYREVGKLASRQGIDPRDFTLLAFGGAGPMLGCFLARELGMHQVLIPTAPGVLSALGGLVADVKNDFISTAYYPLSADELPRLKADFDHLARRASAWITEEQKFTGSYVLQPAADMRYLGQSFEIEVPLPLEWIAAGDIERIAAAFHAEHDRLYGHSSAATPIHMVSLRMVVVGGSPQPKIPAEPRRTGSPVPAKQIDVYLDGAWRKVPLYRRADLGHGHRLRQPLRRGAGRYDDLRSGGLHRRGRRVRQHSSVARPVRGTQCASIRSRCRSSPITRRRPPTAWPSRCSAPPTRPS